MNHFDITGDEVGCFSKETPGWKDEIYQHSQRKKFKKKQPVKPREGIWKHGKRIK